MSLFISPPAFVLNLDTDLRLLLRCWMVSCSARCLPCRWFSDRTTDTAAGFGPCEVTVWWCSGCWFWSETETCVTCDLSCCTELQRCFSSVLQLAADRFTASVCRHSSAVSDFPCPALCLSRLRANEWRLVSVCVCVCRVCGSVLCAGSWC